MRSLDGRTVVLLEARMGEEAAALVRKFGGTPYRVPAVREVDSTDEAGPFIEALHCGSLSVVVFLSGVGVSALIVATALAGLVVFAGLVGLGAVAAIADARPELEAQALDVPAGMPARSAVVRLEQPVRGPLSQRSLADAQGLGGLAGRDVLGGRHRGGASIPIMRILRDSAGFSGFFLPLPTLMGDTRARRPQAAHP